MWLHVSKSPLQKNTGNIKSLFQKPLKMQVEKEEESVRKKKEKKAKKFMET